MRKIFFVLIIGFILSNTVSGNVNNNTSIDSSVFHFQKYRFSKSHESRIESLKKAIEFRPCDSFYFYLGVEYRDIYDIPEYTKQSRNSLTSSIHSGLYDFYALDSYLTGLSLSCKPRQKIRLLMKNKGDSICYLGKRIYYPFSKLIINEELMNIKSLKDSIKNIFKYSNSDEYKYEMLTHLYFNSEKANRAKIVLRRGMKRFPNSAVLLYRKGMISLTEGNYKKAVKCFENANRSDSSGAYDSYIEISKRLVKIHNLH